MAEESTMPDSSEPKWDPGDEGAAPEPELDPATPPLDLDDGGDPDQDATEPPSADEAYATNQQALSPGLDGSPFAHDREEPTLE